MFYFDSVKSGSKSFSWKWQSQKILSVGELNPGLPRDRLTTILTRTVRLCLAKLPEIY